MLGKLIGASVTATAATAAVIIGRAYQQSLLSETSAEANYEAMKLVATENSFNLEV